MVVTTGASADSSKLRSVRALGLKLHAASVLIFVLCAALSLGLFALLRGRAREREQVEFERRAGESAGTLRSQLERPLEVLDSVCSLFDASAEVSRDEFARFTRPALARHPGIRALEWIPLVPGTQRRAYEQAARADGLATFEFTEVADDGRMVTAAARPEYLPIYFMEPADGRVLGFDLTAEPARRAPVDRALARRATVASERIRLVEDPPDRYSIAAFCPVLTRTTGQPAVLRGVGAEVFRMREVVEPAIANAVAGGMQVVVLDVAAPAETRLLFESLPGLTAAGAQASPRPPFSVSIDFADRRWSLSFARGPGYRSDLSEPPWGVLLAGIALSALLALALSAARVILRLRHEVHAAQHFGQYTLVRKIGEGGMGVVWEAKHAMLRRPTALKLLRPERAGGGGNLALRARSAADEPADSPQHRGDLRLRSHRRRRVLLRDGIPRWPGSTALGRKRRPAAAHAYRAHHEAGRGALVEAHGLGLVHRDIKPANIMLCERGGMRDVAKVVDFGLVKGTTTEGASLSTDQMVIGTPLFLAPEAVNDPAHVDGRSDLYALGAVAYYLLTAHTVFDGQSAVEICSQHLYTTPIPPSERLGRVLPEPLERVVLRCLAKKPSHRFEDAHALLQALIACGLPEWTDADARAAAERVAIKRAPDVATARTLPGHSPSQLAIDLSVRADKRK